MKIENYTYCIKYYCKILKKSCELNGKCSCCYIAIEQLKQGVLI